MGTENKPIDNLEESEVLKPPDRPPKSSFATTWIRGNEGFFRVDITIIGPYPHKPEDHFPLRRRKSQSIIKTVSDLVETLKQELR